MLAVKARIRQQVEAELKFIEDQFGPMPQNTAPSTWLNVIGEEAGEASRALIDGDVEGYIKELSQVAACAMAAIEDLYLGNGSKTIEAINQWQAKVEAWRNANRPEVNYQIVNAAPGQEAQTAKAIAKSFEDVVTLNTSPNLLK